MLIKTMKWDSSFFGIKIGKIDVADFTLSDFEKAKNKFGLIYIQALSDNCEHLETIKSFAHFEDRKLIYSKKISKTVLSDNDVSVYNSKIANKKLVSLALLSGVYSRFKLDPNFKKKDFEQLYRKWIENSVTKKMAFCVLIAGDEKNPDGFITIQQNGDVAQVGLFAVNNNAQNKGIGKKLLSTAEYFAQINNFDTLKIATQESNKHACKFYEKCGYTIQSNINTFHYWNK